MKDPEQTRRRGQEFNEFRRSFADNFEALTDIERPEGGDQEAQRAADPAAVQTQGGLRAAARGRRRRDQRGEDEARGGDTGRRAVPRPHFPPLSLSVTNLSTHTRPGTSISVHIHGTRNDITVIKYLPAPRLARPPQQERFCLCNICVHGNLLSAVRTQQEAVPPPGLNLITIPQNLCLTHVTL